MARDEETTFDPTIDENDLFSEWSGQPKMFRKWAARHAQAMKEHTEAENSLELVAAQLQLEIRKAPEEFELPKVTEEVIKAAVIVQPDYQTAQAEVVQAKYKADMLKAAVSAMEHRKKALEKMVELELREYNSEPRAPAVAKEKIEEFKKRSIRTRGRKSA